MAIFSVDSEAVLTQSAAIRATGERLQSDTTAMLAQLGQLQSSWTGSASLAFQDLVERWRVTQRSVDALLADLGAALGTAGTQYAQTELSAAGLFH